MKINNIHITNWEEPGGPYWDNVKERHSEPLIEATMKLTLSWDEYETLLAEDKKAANARWVPV